jgi:serine phosphatase RsbU (regulator of sigma subunit)
VLGILEAEFEEAQVALGGDLVVLYTDGVSGR